MGEGSPERGPEERTEAAAEPGGPEADRPGLVDQGEARPPEEVLVCPDREDVHLLQNSKRAGEPLEAGKSDLRGTTSIFIELFKFLRDDARPKNRDAKLQGL